MVFTMCIIDFHQTWNVGGWTVGLTLQFQATAKYKRLIWMQRLMRQTKRRRETQEPWGTLGNLGNLGEPCKVLYWFLWFYTWVLMVLYGFIWVLIFWDVCMFGFLPVIHGHALCLGVHEWRTSTLRTGGSPHWNDSFWGGWGWWVDTTMNGFSGSTRFLKNHCIGRTATCTIFLDWDPETWSRLTVFPGVAQTNLD